MGNQELEIKDIISAFKEIIGKQAEEIAVLKATISAMSRQDTVE